MNNLVDVYSSIEVPLVEIFSGDDVETNKDEHCANNDSD